MNTSYTYSIATDTMNGKIAPRDLYLAIIASAIIVSCPDVSTSGDVITIAFKDALSMGDKTILDGVVSTHTGMVAEVLEQVENKTILTDGGLTKADEGFKFTATAGQTTTYDHLFTRTMHIKGGYIISDNNVIMDEYTLTMVDKSYMYAGVLYPMDYNGTAWSVAAPNGVDIHAYQRNMPLRKGGETEIENYAITDLDMNGLTLRMEYVSTGATDVNINCAMIGYMK